MGLKNRRYVPYNYESAFEHDVLLLNSIFLESMLSNRYKCVYVCKEIRAGNQLEIEIYPEFKKINEVPPEGREKSQEAQKNLNNKNAIKYCERIINENFTEKDIWLTLTYSDEQEPKDWPEALKNIQNFIRRVNYQRKKRELEKCKYLYVTEHDPDAKIRWHHHLIMSGDMDRDIVEGCWKQGDRTHSRRLEPDEYGLAGMARYITKQKNRRKNEKRWGCSTGLRQFRVRKVYSKPKGGKGRYVPIDKYIDSFVRDKHEREKEIQSWHPEADFMESSVYYNGVNGMFYIKARLRTRGGVKDSGRHIYQNNSQRTSPKKTGKVPLHNRP